ncbi:MAG: CPBP family intramembrane glutamic endopeptidase [Devosia sp.]
MTTETLNQAALIKSPASPPKLQTSFVARHPFWSFVFLAYLWSWCFWGLAAFAPGTTGQIAHYAGGFGPLIGAALVVRQLGGSVLAWFKGLFKWRLNPIWYLFALSFPILLIAVMSLAYLALGHSLDFSLLSSRMAAYLPTFLFLTGIGGGNEEPGWRGFGLGALQRVHGPMRSTLLLGAVWALWHLPLLASDPDVMRGSVALGTIAATIVVTFLSISVHAFWYTWLVNRTGSVLLCILLHGSYNTANGLLLLVPQGELEANYPTLLTLMTSVLVASVLALIIVTRGRLGRAPQATSAK